MANFFAQFHDTPEEAAPSGTPNFFSQFHSDSPAPSAPAGPPEKKFGLEDTWPARLAKSIYSAVTLPGDVMSGTAHVPGSADAQAIPGAAPFGSADSSGDRIADLATLGTPMSPAARVGVGWAGVTKSKAAPAPTQEALESAATAGYDKARNLGVEIHPDAISALGDKIGSHLNEIGIDGELAPKTFSILKRLTNPPEASVVTVPNLETLRRSFGHAAGDFSNPTEQLAAKRAQGHLADYLASIPDQDVIRGPASEVSGIIKDANANYAAAKRSEQISDALKKAELQTAATHSGRNLDNKTRQSFVRLLTDDKTGAGFTQSELDATESIIKGSKPADLMRSAGNFLGGGGGLGMLHGSSIGAAGGAAVAGPLGAAIGATTVPALGYALKKGADASTMNKVEAFQQMVRNRSPLADSMPDTVVGSVSPKQAFMARLIAGGFVPQQGGESAVERFKREMLLRSALSAQSVNRN
ncbi:MAG: hypothetical protein JWP25_3622 [Bradyrhizobium sp.]|nr:hypothetical protein [Bradyrhizobium sp.]